MNLAIVADWLTTFGGAEHAIAEFRTLWPSAPLFTTVANPRNLGPLADADIRTSALQKWYKLIGNHQLLLPWMPAAIEAIDLRGFDVILSSSHAVAKGVVIPQNAVHICYCHTPMRYAWEMEETYLNDFRIPSLLRKPVKTQLRKLRRWDLTTAKRVDTFIANSIETQERIRRIYGRESIVIAPPVSEQFFSAALQPMTPRSSFLAVGRLVPYKRFDLLIEVANELSLPLLIAGRGQDEARLKKLAGATVRFLGFVSDAELLALYASSRALLFPQREDAGIVPLEAQAAGTPVIAYGGGGALDSIRDGESGLFFAQQTAPSLREALRKFSTLIFDPKQIRNHAQQFTSQHFRERISQAVTVAVNAKQR